MCYHKKGSIYSSIQYTDVSDACSLQSACWAPLHPDRFTEWKNRCILSCGLTHIDCVSAAALTFALKDTYLKTHGKMSEC